MNYQNVALVSTIAGLLINSPATIEAIDRVSPGGIDPNGSSYESALSKDGRYIFIESRATNLILGDTNSNDDVFRLDRETGTVIRVSTDGANAELHAASGNPAPDSSGNLVAFDTSTAIAATDSNSNFDVYLKNITTGAVEQISVSSGGAGGNAQSQDPDMSADGTRIVFESNANNLDIGDTGLDFDIFIRDLNLGTTTRISKAAGGGEADDHSFNPRISADGRYVVFESDAANLVAGDMNSASDIFLYTVETGALERISEKPDGTEADFGSIRPDISGDGNMVVFQSDATNLDANDMSTLDSVYVANRSANTLEVLLNPAGNAIQAATDPVVSGPGNLIAFTCDDASVIPGDTEGKRDILVYDTAADSYGRVSETAAGTGADAACYDPAISEHGNVISFGTLAANLIAGDMNGETDIYYNLNPIASYQPDLRIGNRRSLSSHKGDNRYNGGGGQVGKLNLSGRRKGKLYLSGQNDGNVTSSLNLRLPKAPKSRDLSYKFFRLTGGKKNIKAATKRAGFVTDDAAPGATITYYFECKGKGKKKARYTGKPTLNSPNDPAGKKDVNKMKIVAKP